MANANSTEAPALPQIQHPFIDNQLEDTWIHVNAVLAMLEEYQLGLALNFEQCEPPTASHHYGALYVLRGVRQAVAHMRNSAEEASNVRKLEGKS